MSIEVNNRADTAVNVTDTQQTRVRCVVSCIIYLLCKFVELLTLQR